MLRRTLCWLAFLLSLPFSAAQVTTGTPQFGSFGGGPFDTINLANLNVQFKVPLITKPGRGLPFFYVLDYESSVWNLVTSGGTNTWVPATNWGWTGQTDTVTGTVLFTTQTIPICNPWGTTQFTWTAYVDDLGVRHPFNFTTNYCNALSGSGNATDNSGYHMTVTYGSGWVVTVTSPNGKVLNNPPLNNSVGAVTKTDNNGNQVTTTNGTTFTDTTGRTVLTITGASPTVTYTYTGPDGTNTAVTIGYTNKTIQTTFCNPGVVDYAPHYNVPLITSITYPDGTHYNFTYETTPPLLSGCTSQAPVAGAVTGRIASITLPTGGSISYSYIGGNNGVAGNGDTAGFVRTLADGTNSNASTFWISGAGTTYIVDPQQNETDITFVGDLYETSRQIYQGRQSTGTLLLRTTTCWNTPPACPQTSAPSRPITLKDYYISHVVGGQNTRTSMTRTTYSTTNELPSEIDEWDYQTQNFNGPKLRKTLITYQTFGSNSLGTGIVDRPATITVQEDSGATRTLTKFYYDQNALVSTTGNSPAVPQHIAVTGSRGNLTQVKSWVSGPTDDTGTYLSKSFYYYDTGTPSTVSDVNSAVTTYNYDPNTSCGYSYVTSVTMPVTTLVSRATSDCNGGVITSATGFNGEVTNYGYNVASDPHMWRVKSITDPLGNVTSVGYSAAVREVNMVFNTNSIVDSALSVDGLGRPRISQRRQGATGSALNTFDSVQTDYDTAGRFFRSTMPYVGSGGQLDPDSPPTYAQTITYDNLNRVKSVTDGGGGVVNYTYNQNDVLIEVDPAPAGEQPKKRQLEYDALGRLTSVCEITSAAGSGTCGQDNSQTGYWTRYQYNAAGSLTAVCQNTFTTGIDCTSNPPFTQQTRQFTYDGLGRLTQESNPESGTVSYSYDVIPSPCGGAGTHYNGDLTQKYDQAGNRTCYYYDAMHRVSDVGFAGPTCRRFRYDSRTVAGVAMANANGHLSEAFTDNCGTTQYTDEGFSYSARGEVADVYQKTPNSGATYYHVAATYWPHGLMKTVSGVPSLPSITYGGTIGSTSGVDGEGRITQVTASGGQNPVTNAVYNTQPPFVSYNPLGALTSLSLGSGDNDVFQYDLNTGRLVSYQFNVGIQYEIGSLNWNQNGSLGSLNISTDQFNAANVQLCNYTHDDLARLASVNCGTGKWGQNFSYDVFGNINKTVPTGNTGTSFTPSYVQDPYTLQDLNKMMGYSYDPNGNLLSDTIHSYTWDAYGNPVCIDNTTINYDALGRAVEQASGGTCASPGTTYKQIVYGPDGGKLALMNGQSLLKAFVPLPGGATAVYNSSGLAYYMHSDWLGSSRLASSPARTVLWDGAYAPFGESYAETAQNSAYHSFTGQNEDTVSGLDDFMFREFSASQQGRWISPDPAGLAAVDPSDPQTWNRYGYVRNSALQFADPLGFGPCFANVTVFWMITQGVLEIQGVQIDAVFCQDGGRGGGGGGGGGAGTGAKSCFAGIGPPAPGQSRCLDELPQDPCRFAGTNPDPSYWAGRGADAKNNLFQSTFDLTQGFPKGNYFDAQPSAAGNVYERAAYGNYVFGVYTAAAGWPLTAALSMADYAAYRNKRSNPTQYQGRKMGTLFSSIPDANAVNIAAGYDAQKSGTLCQKP